MFGTLMLPIIVSTNPSVSYLSQRRCPWAGPPRSTLLPHHRSGPKNSSWEIKVRLLPNQVEFEGDLKAI